MLRIIYNLTEIISVMDNDLNSGISYTLERVIICTSDEALVFFADYPEEEKQKLTDFINDNFSIPSPYEYIEV